MAQNVSKFLKNSLLTRLIIVFVVFILLVPGYLILLRNNKKCALPAQDACLIKTHDLQS